MRVPKRVDGRHMPTQHIQRYSQGGSNDAARPLGVITAATCWCRYEKRRKNERTYRNRRLVFESSCHASSWPGRERRSRRDWRRSATASERTSANQSQRDRCRGAPRVSDAHLQPKHTRPIPVTAQLISTSRVWVKTENINTTAVAGREQ